MSFLVSYNGENSVLGYMNLTFSFTLIEEKGKHE